MVYDEALQFYPLVQLLSSWPYSLYFIVMWLETVEDMEHHLLFISGTFHCSLIPVGDSVDLVVVVITRFFPRPPPPIPRPSLLPGPATATDGGPFAYCWWFICTEERPSSSSHIRE